MEIVLQLPDAVATILAPDGDYRRGALESIAAEGYRSGRLSGKDVADLLGLSRVEAEDFLGRRGVSLERYSESALDAEASIFPGTHTHPPA